MPIYDYVCANCRHRTEVIHGIHDAGPKFCPNCGAEGTLRKALTAPSVHFKGSGWAKKDRSSSSGVRTKAGTGSSDAGSSDGADAGSKSGADASAEGSSSKGKSTAGSEPGKGASASTSSSED